MLFRSSGVYASRVPLQHTQANYRISTGQTCRHRDVHTQTANRTFLRLFGIPLSMAITSVSTNYSSITETWGAQEGLRLKITVNGVCVGEFTRTQFGICSLTGPGNWPNTTASCRDSSMLSSNPGTLSSSHTTTPFENGWPNNKTSSSRTTSNSKTSTFHSYTPSVTIMARDPRLQGPA